MASRAPHRKRHFAPLQLSLHPYAAVLLPSSPPCPPRASSAVTSQESSSTIATEKDAMSWPCSNVITPPDSTKCFPAMAVPAS